MPCSQISYNSLVKGGSTCNTVSNERNSPVSSNRTANGHLSKEVRNLKALVDLACSERTRDALVREAASALGARAGKIRTIPLVPLKGVADETTKLGVVDHRGRLLAVIMVSSPVAPNMVARGIERARNAAAALGPDLGKVLLLPLCEGVVDGLTFAITRAMTPLSRKRIIGRIHHWRIAPSVLHWLTAVTALTHVNVRSEERAARFGRPLEYFSSLDAVPRELRDQAGVALQRLSEGKWEPDTVLMHGDLWAANILIDRRRRDWSLSERFVVIDWAGSMVKGYAVYDLTRLAISLRCSKARFRAELTSQLGILGCDPEDAMSYLVAALGHLALHLENFPMDRFMAMSKRCAKYLTENTT